MTHARHSAQRPRRVGGNVGGLANPDPIHDVVSAEYLNMTAPDASGTRVLTTHFDDVQAH